MKKGLYAILAALAVFALVMTGCPDGGGGGNTVEPNDNAALSSIKLGDLTSSASAPAETLAEIKEKPPKIIRLSADVEYEVTLNFGGSSDAPFKGKAEYAHVKTAADLEDGSFKDYKSDAKPKLALVDDDLIYVKMTAENGKTVNYYVFKVEIGRNADLKAADEGGITFTNGQQTFNITDLGTPSATALPNAANQGKMQFSLEVNDIYSWTVTANPADTNAGVKLYKGRDITRLDRIPDSDWNVITNGAELTLADGEFLYVWVTSANGKAKNYYKISIIFPRSTSIKFGTPGSINAENPDPIWDSIEWLPIDRINTTEEQEITLLDQKARTFGRAKLLWDWQGLYIYAQVWENYISATEFTDSSQAHQKSSVELFINEANAKTGTVASGVNENGGQYRLGANGGRSGPQANQTEAFDNLNKSSAKKWTSNNFPYAQEGTADPQTIQETDIKNGYVVIFQAPWLFPDKYPLVEGKEFTLEIQINAMGQSGSRNGVLNWNSASSNSYSSVVNFGAGKLGAPGSAQPAMQPTINTQPASVTVNQGSTGAIPALTVAAASPDGGGLSYQWCSAPSAVIPATDTPVTTGTGGTSASYIPAISTATVSTSYFYVVVTNTKGDTTNIRRSNVVSVRVIDPSVSAVTLELVNNTVANWDATAGALVIEKAGGWGNYAQTEAEIPINTTFNGDAYARIEFVISGFYGDGTAVTDFGTSQYSLDFCPRLFKGSSDTVDWNNNASAAQVTVGTVVTTQWNLPGTKGSSAIEAADLTFSDNTWKVVVYAKNGTNSTKKIEKLIIKSVKLIAKE
jgi:hypothetical protein